MTDYSDRRVAEAQARQAQQDQNTRDFTRGLNGQNVPSTWGQIGLQQSQANHPVAYGTPAADDVSGRRDTSGPRRASANRRAATPSQPWMPGVDAWLASLPKGVFFTMAAVGAVCGLGYGLSTGNAGHGLAWALGGGLIGLFLIHTVAKLFKVAVAAALIGGTGLLIYFLITHFGH